MGVKYIIVNPYCECDKMLNSNTGSCAECSLDTCQCRTCEQECSHRDDNLECKEGGD